MLLLTASHTIARTVLGRFLVLRAEVSTSAEAWALVMLAHLASAFAGRTGGRGAQFAPPTAKKQVAVAKALRALDHITLQFGYTGSYCNWQ